MLASVLAALALTHLGLGWYLGFRSITSYVACWILFGLTGTIAYRATRSVFKWSGLADAIVHAGVIFFGSIVLAGLVLGSVGWIGTVPYLCLFAGGCAATFALKPSREAPHISLSPLPIPIAAVLWPLLVCIVAVGLLQSPLTLYDSLSYHLVFPARWLLDHRITIIPTPFSDPAQAYQPGNGELFFLWLMLPFHGDLLARVGQLPFLMLGGVALYAMARRTGAQPAHAAYAPLFFCMARPVVEQVVGADVDLVCAATFVTSLYLGIVAVDTDSTRDWMLWGVSLGLYLGSKYLALVYLPVLLVLPLLRGPRLKAAWALPGILLLGFPWYARNWLIAGSPIYPSSLKLMGLTIARGAFSREAMNNSVFHVTSVRLLPAIVAHAFGAASLLFWLPCAVLGACSLLARRRWWPGGYILLTPIAMAALFWFAIPDNADSRFLLPAVAIAMVPLAWPFGSNTSVNACLHAIYLAGAAWLVIGVRSEIPKSLPWFMKNWLTLEGLVSREALPLFAAGVGVSAFVAFAAWHRPRLAALVVVTAFGAACLTVTIGSHGACGGGVCALLDLSPTYIRVPVVVGWQWVHDHVADSTIAYSGNNLPYPLFGEHLANRVVYVNIDRHADWRFHDYARARSKEGRQDSVGALARGSGQLEPIKDGRDQDAARPRYERREGYSGAWIQNLQAAGARYVFVSVLSAYEIDYVWHNAGGFPIEDEWAKSDGRDFTLVYENGQVRVYTIARP